MFERSWRQHPSARTNSSTVCGPLSPSSTAQGIRDPGSHATAGHVLLSRARGGAAAWPLETQRGVQSSRPGKRRTCLRPRQHQHCARPVYSIGCCSLLPASTSQQLPSFPNAKDATNCRGTCADLSALESHISCGDQPAKFAPMTLLPSRGSWATCMILVHLCRSKSFHTTAWAA